VPNASVGPIPPPLGRSNCRPEIRTATATEFVLANPAKQSNFIVGELVNGRLSFIVENLPKDGSGCPGKWMFAEMMKHFGSSVSAVQGFWNGPLSDNLTAVNKLTGAGMPLEEAAKATWTGRQAAAWGCVQVQVVSARGTLGKFTSVRVVFTK
jgi:hypothetical protein